MALFDRPYTTFYWSAIVSIALSCTVFEFRGRAPVGVWAEASEVQKVLRHEAEKLITDRKNKSTQTDIV